MSQSMAASSAAGSSAGGGSAIEMERMLSHGVAARLSGGVGGGRIAGLDSDDDGSDEEEQLEHKLLDESRRFSMRRFTEVAANARFPSMSFLVAILAFQGIVYASVHLSTFAEDTAHSTVGVLGVLLAISFVILSTVLVQQQRLRFFPYINLHPWLKEKFESKDLESQQRWRNARTKGFLGDGKKGNAADPDDVLEATRCRSVSQFDRAGGNSAKSGGGFEKLQYKWYLAWIYPLGTWGPSRQRLMYSKLFSAYTGTAKTWFVFPLLLCVGVNVITVVHPSSLRGCFIQLTCLGVLFSTAALITIIRQPMRCIYKNVLSTTAFLCFACSAAARGTNLFLMRDVVGSELGSTTPPARTAVLAYRIALVSTLVQVILIGVRSLLDGLFTYLESHHWRPRNQLYLESLAEEGRDAKRQARVDLQKKRRELMMQSAAGGVGSSFRGTDGHTGLGESSLGGVPLDSDRAGLSGSSFGGDSSASGDESGGGGGGGGQGLTAATLAGFDMPDDRHRGGSRRFSRMNRVSTTAAETRKRSARVGRLQATADAHESNIEWLLGGKRSAPEAAPTTERAPTTKPKRRVGVKFDI